MIDRVHAPQCRSVLQRMVLVNQGSVKKYQSILRVLGLRHCWEHPLQHSAASGGMRLER